MFIWKSLIPLPYICVSLLLPWKKKTETEATKKAFWISLFVFLTTKVSFVSGVYCSTKSLFFWNSSSRSCQSSKKKEIMDWQTSHALFVVQWQLLTSGKSKIMVPFIIKRNFNLLSYHNLFLPQILSFVATSGTFWHTFHFQ